MADQAVMERSLPRATGNSSQVTAVWLQRSRYRDYRRDNRHLVPAPWSIHARGASAPSMGQGRRERPPGPSAKRGSLRVSP